MNSREDLFSVEASLINRSKRELADGREKDPIHKLRLMCYTRGPIGITNLSKALRRQDRKDGNGLGLKEFEQGIHESGIDCSPEDARDMFKKLDHDGKGRITMSDFLKKIRAPMSESRSQIVSRAFSKINKSGSGVVTLRDIRRSINVKDHPKYLSGEMSAEEIITDTIKNFGQGVGDNTSEVTKEDFENYYATISAAIENDAYFDLMIRRTYGIN